MKVQQLKQSVNLQNLEDWGKAGLTGTTPIQVSGWSSPAHSRKCCSPSKISVALAANRYSLN
ncbi:hypothetical protein CI15_23895 [Paraburkholderia monticola]|uniref:Uncharacterized protein n=2 Tax=Paraburkholderia monticola TaxID=1399968 RepID=A0A149PHH2_9BURK|nr:hypothetical protein CI15_23895 [Paraburkholderia monticola]